MWRSSKQPRPGLIRLATTGVRWPTAWSIWHPLPLTSTAAGLMPTAGQGILDLGPMLPGPPTTVREFNVDEDIAVFAEVYENAQDMPPHVLDLSTTVRSDIGQIVFENREERSSTELEGGRGGFGYSVEIPSGTLAPGLYVIHLEARSRLDNDSGIGRDIQIRIH